MASNVVDVGLRNPLAEDDVALLMKPFRTRKNAPFSKQKSKKNFWGGAPPLPMILLICYAHGELTSACDRSTCGWRATPLSFDVSFLENPCGHPYKLYIAKN